MLAFNENGRPQITEELQELGLNVGTHCLQVIARSHREGRVGRLMRQKGIKIVMPRKYKATTESKHAFKTAPNLLDQGFSADAPNQKCPFSDALHRLSGHRRVTLRILTT